MTPRVVLLGVLFLCAALSGCATPPVDEDAVQAEVTAAISTYLRHLNALALDSAAALFADDPRFQWYEDGVLRYRSRAEVAQALAGLGSMGTVEVDGTVGDVLVLGPDAAWATARSTTRVVPEGSDGFQFDAVMTVLVVRTPDGWRFLAGHVATPRQRGGP